MQRASGNDFLEQLLALVELMAIAQVHGFLKVMLDGAECLLIYFDVDGLPVDGNLRGVAIGRIELPELLHQVVIITELKVQLVLELEYIHVCLYLFDTCGFCWLTVADAPQFFVRFLQTYKGNQIY